MKFRILFLLVLIPALASAVSWNGNGDPYWHDSNSWNGGNVPDGVNAVATFGNTNSNTVWILFDNATVGTLQFTSSDDYNLTTLIRRIEMNVSSGSAAITNSNGDNVISAPVHFMDNTNVTVTAGTLTFNGQMSNAGTITKLGNGTMFIGGSSMNNFTGGMVVSLGTLMLEKTVANAAINSNLIVQTGGTVLLGNANQQIGDSVGVTLSGGTLGSSGGGSTTEDAGTLTLSANSTLNMGGSNSIWTFDSFAGGGTLTITNWAGSMSGGGADQIRFDSITNAQLAQVKFDIGGTLYDARLIGNELVPVPEPSTVIAGILLVSVALGRRNSFGRCRYGL